MTDGGFAYSQLFAKDLPPPAPRWTGFPKYNFIGGHNDPARIPAAALAEAATAVLRRRGGAGQRWPPRRVRWRGCGPDRCGRR